MLTLEEGRWALRAFKVFSILNMLPIQVDVKNGKIQRHSSTIRLFIWKLLYGVGVSQCLFVFGRFVQSTILEPEKYFRWDHFVFHFGLTFAGSVFYYTGYCLFVTHAEESVIIFNQLFATREDPVQKMMDQQLQIRMPSKSGNGNRVNKTRARSGVQIVSTSFQIPAQKDDDQNEAIEDESKYKAEVRRRPLLTWPPQYSLDEVLAKILPPIAVITGFFLILILAIDPSRPQLLYSVLPPEHQNISSFLSLLAVETLWVFIIMFYGSFALVNQILFFGKCQLEFKRMSLQLRNLQDKFQDGTFGARHIKNEIWILRQILDEMRKLVFLIELFNRCFPFCIFGWKICSLSVCIVFYFFVIRHFHDFPFLGLFISYAAVIMTFIYTVVYGRAFSIPGKMDELKNEFLLTAQKTTRGATEKWNVSRILWAGMKREVKRIRGVGIKVGNFNQMERESTPRFVDFVLRNIVTLLVTIPR